ncbi:MAG: hypothetical protein FJY80_01325 [Candidatus Aminicenantes bacterium]|nr:hypothetical protein [Candidatus Aminicenantes bacterium]
MEKTRFKLLKSDLETQLAEIGKIFARIEKRKAIKEKIVLESLAYQLHNLYCAFEDLVKIIAGFFENNIEDKKKYHRELLWRMTVSVEGVRPSLLSAESFALLDSLRAFRHFFRHAYAYELDPKKVALVLDETLRLKALYKQDCRAFLEAVGTVRV